MRGNTPHLRHRHGARKKAGQEGYGGCEVQQGRQQERHLHDGRRGGLGKPWGVEITRDKKGRPPGLGKCRTLGSGGNLWRP